MGDKPWPNPGARPVHGGAVSEKRYTCAKESQKSESQSNYRVLQNRIVQRSCFAAFCSAARSIDARSVEARPLRDAAYAVRIHRDVGARRTTDIPAHLPR